MADNQSLLKQKKTFNGFFATTCLSFCWFRRLIVFFLTGKTFMNPKQTFKKLLQKITSSEGTHLVSLFYFTFQQAIFTSRSCSLLTALNEKLKFSQLLDVHKICCDKAKMRKTCHLERKIKCRLTVQASRNTQLCPRTLKLKLKSIVVERERDPLVSLYKNAVCSQ